MKKLSKELVKGFIKKWGKKITAGIIIIGVLFSSTYFIVVNNRLASGKNEKTLANNNQDQVTEAPVQDTAPTDASTTTTDTQPTQDTTKDTSKDTTDTTKTTKKPLKQVKSRTHNGVAVTSEYYNKYISNSVLRVSNISDISRNGNDYIGKDVYIAGLQVTQIDQSNGLEFLICHQPGTDEYMHIVYEYTVLNKKFLVGDSISFVGTIDDIKVDNDHLLPVAISDYVEDSTFNGRMFQIYSKLYKENKNNYELRPYIISSNKQKYMYEVYDTNTNTKLDKYIYSDGAAAYWCDKNWNISDLIV